MTVFSNEKKTFFFKKKSSSSSRVSVYLLPSVCPRLIVTPPPSHKPLHYYPVALTTGVSGDFILIRCMIFSDTSSERLPRSSAESENNRRASFSLYSSSFHSTSSWPPRNSPSYQQLSRRQPAALLVCRADFYVRSKNIRAPAFFLCTENLISLSEFQKTETQKRMRESNFPLGLCLLEDWKVVSFWGKMGRFFPPTHLIFHKVDVCGLHTMLIRNNSYSNTFLTVLKSVQQLKIFMQIFEC